MKKIRYRLFFWAGALALTGSALINSNDAHAQADWPQIGLDAKSNRLVVWRASQLTNQTEIRSALLSGSKWTVFDDPISNSTYSHAPILDVHYESGNAIAVWSGTDSSSGNSVVQVALYNGSKKSWLSSFTISSSEDNSAGDYKANINGSGVACVTWSAYSKTDQVIYAATIDFSGTINRTQLFP